jgi:hypothetical protein
MVADPTWPPLQTNTLTGDSLYFSNRQWLISPPVSTVSARREPEITFPGASKFTDHFWRIPAH